jgi:nucleoside-diphosphate-sugar epimerase
MQSKTEVILITGAGGYVGSSLVPHLLNLGKKVIAFDLFWYGNDLLPPHPNLKIIKGDLCNFDFKNILHEVDQVIHLACISNDPSFDLNPEISKKVNFDGAIRFIDQLNNFPIKRFIFASSSSVYGVSNAPTVNELLTPNPITPYALYKLKIEEYLLNHLSKNIDLVILRPATLCGPSPRLRLDLVTNLLAAHAYYHGRISIHGGEQFRPQLNIKEMIRVYVFCINWKENFNSEIFNIGELNYTVNEIAELLQLHCPHQFELIRVPVIDQRSYRISSDKFYNQFNQSVIFKLKDAIDELFLFFKQSPALNLNYENFHNVQKLKNINYEP